EAQHTSVPSESNPLTTGAPSNPSPFVDTPPHSLEFTPVSPSKPSNAAPNVAASHTEVPPAVPRTTGLRTRSRSIDANIKTYTTRRKSLAPRKMPSSGVDLTAPDDSFIHVLLNDDSDDTNDSDPLFFWHAFAAWEVVPTGLGDVNALYFTDKTSKYFTHLREILHLLDNTPYPLSVSLMKKMLKHKLEVEIDGVGNDMTYAVQLIKYFWMVFVVFEVFEVFGWQHLVPTGRYVVPTGRVIATVSIKVPTGRYIVPAGYIISPGRVTYVVPTGKDNVIVSAGRSKVIPAGRTILVLVVLCLLRVDSIVS
ncbi:hypothetical protein Tco_1267951, partial [Tanacetum coccineum]